MKEILQDIPLKMKLAMAGALIVLLITIIGCSGFWKNYPQDNIVEEIVEEVIDKETGLDIDLSPFTPD